MKLGKGAGLVTLAIIGGFAFGFLWGKASRSRMGENIKTDFSGGTLTVQVAAYNALKTGLIEALQ